MVSEMFGLQGKKAVVTGAGNPLAHAIGVALADAGADVAAVSARPDAAQALADAVRGLGRTSVAIEADSSRSADVSRLTEEAAAALGPIDIVVLGEEALVAGPADDVTEAVWDEVMTVNVKSVHLCAQAFGRSMRERGHGRIIVLAHALGVAGVPNTAVYSASKGALVQYVRSLGLEWATTGVTVNAIAPGWFHEAWPDRTIDEDQLARFNPMRRLGAPDDLSGLAVYMASDAAAYMTATVAIIDGGQICHA